MRARSGRPRHTRSLGGRCGEGIPIVERETSGKSSAATEFKSVRLYSCEPSAFACRTDVHQTPSGGSEQEGFATERNRVINGRAGRRAGSVDEVDGEPAAGRFAAISVLLENR
jgi:hypothetical protein